MHCQILVIHPKALFLLAGRVVTQGTPLTPPRNITIGETTGTVQQNTSGNSKVAISPLKSPGKVSF